MRSMRKLDFSRREQRRAYVDRVKHICKKAECRLDAVERIRQLNAGCGIKIHVKDKTSIENRLRVRMLLEENSKPPFRKQFLLGVFSMAKEDANLMSMAKLVFEEYLFLKVKEQVMSEVLFVLSFENLLEGREADTKGKSKMCNSQSCLQGYMSPYALAMESGSEAISAKLFEFGAYPLLVDAEGLIGVNRAILNGSEALVERFVEEGY